MATIPHFVPVGPYPTIPVAANALDVTFTPADPSGDDIQLTAPVLLLARNTDSSAHTVTITSQPDPFNRTGSISAYSLGAGEVMAFLLSQATGWRDADGLVRIQASNAAVTWAVIRLA